MPSSTAAAPVPSSPAPVSPIRVSKGVSRNPWNPAFTTGGSSGGAGGALAAGTTTLANGSDIWGSIRMPASCCGVVGFKPPYGRVPEDVPFNLDPYCHEGPLARTVEDLALLENVMAGPHPEDIATVKPKLTIPKDLKPVKGWKVAYSVDLGYFEVDPEVAANTEATLDCFRALGASVEEVDLGWDERVLTAASNHLGHLFGTMVARCLARDREVLTNYAREFALFSRRITADDFFETTVVAGEMYQTLGPLLERYDLFVCPTMPLPAVAADYDPGIGGVEINGRPVHPVWGWCMTYPFNMMSRCPVLSVPSGFCRERCAHRCTTGGPHLRRCPRLSRRRGPGTLAPALRYGGTKAGDLSLADHRLVKFLPWNCNN